MVSNERVNSVEDVVLEGVLAVVDSHDESVWEGSMSDLRESLVSSLPRNLASEVPQSPNGLRVQLNKVVNRLRARGVGVKFSGDFPRTHRRLVTFTSSR
jgi:hypothetical protein